MDMRTPDNPEKRRAREALYRSAAAPKIAARQARYLAKNRDVLLIRKAAYRAEHRDEIAARKALWRAKNKEKIAAENLKYKTENPERAAIHAARHRARKQGNRRFARTARDRNRQIARQRGRCFYCPTALEPGRGTHEEHVIPLSRGGRDAVGNIVYACPRCNLSKGTGTVMEWRMRQRRIAAVKAA